MAAVSTYFASFPGFSSNPRATILEEFARLAKFNNWGKKSQRYKEERQACLAAEFHHHYGESTKLEGWQLLYAEVGLVPIPESITRCRQVLNTVWVNLVDLLDCRRAGKVIPTHESVHALRAYSRKHGKILPIKLAKRDGFIKQLLIRMG